MKWELEMVSIIYSASICRNIADMKYSQFIAANQI